MHGPARQGLGTCADCDLLGIRYMTVFTSWNHVGQRLVDTTGREQPELQPLSVCPSLLLPAKQSATSQSTHSHSPMRIDRSDDSSDVSRG